MILRSSRFVFLGLFFHLVLASGAGAQALEAARNPPPPSGYPVMPGIWRLYGNDPFLAVDDDLEPLRQVIGKASVVALGETIHTSGGYYRLKHRVFRFLVEKMGFRVFAFESPWTNADRVANYVQTCEGTPEEALRGIFGVWQSTETRDLVQWMCEWNQSHPKPKDRLYFFGFDIQQPDHDGPALLAYLDRIGVAAEDPWVAGVRACDGVVVYYEPGRVPVGVHEPCVQALQEIDGHFQRNARTLQRQTSKKDFELAKLRLVGLRAWEDEVFYYNSDPIRSYSARDAGMAYAFQVLRGQRFPKAKVAVWAHNSHIARALLRAGERPMGSHLAAALGSNYVNLALASYKVAIDWLNVGCGATAVRTGDGSVEEPLHQLGEAALLVDLRFPGTDAPYLPRASYSLGNRSLVPHDLYTGILYLESSPKMTPLAWRSCQ
jgi:erythromycin esterase